MEKIKKALKTLNIKGKIAVEYISPHIIKVCVNDNYFGIWCALRDTFVD